MSSTVESMDPEGVTEAPVAAGSAATRYALLPLRLFLGVTFVYAGLDKLADADYLAGAADPSSFVAQLQSVAGHSPIEWLLRLAVQAPTVSGLGLAFGELAVGLGTLFGLWGRVAAAGGATVSLILFLSASWQVTPYYLGNDLVYLMAWVPLVLAGTPYLSLDAALARRPGRRAGGGRTRRQIIADGGIAALGVAGAGLLAGAGAARLRGRPGAAAAPVAPAPSASASASAAGVTVRAASVPVGGGFLAAMPGSGDPLYVVQPKPGEYAAFSGVCTHAGCTVNPPKDGQFLCPCHGSCFDAATGAVLKGPATRPLPGYPVHGSGGELHIAT